MFANILLKVIIMKLYSWVTAKKVLGKKFPEKSPKISH